MAKGYSTELVVTELLEKDMSFCNKLNWQCQVTGRPQTSGRNKWGVGIQDPKAMFMIEEDPP